MTTCCRLHVAGGAFDDSDDWRYLVSDKAQLCRQILAIGGGQQRARAVCRCIIDNIKMEGLHDCLGSAPESLATACRKGNRSEKNLAPKLGTCHLYRTLAYCRNAAAMNYLATQSCHAAAKNTGAATAMSGTSPINPPTDRPVQKTRNTPPAKENHAARRDGGFLSGALCLSP